MKYVYYYIWLLLAFLPKKISPLYFLSNFLAVRLQKISEEEQEKRRNNFNKAFFEFPGGILDGHAFAGLLIVVLLPIMLLCAYLRIPIFESELYFLGLLLVAVGYIYFLIYYRSLSWLKKKINAVKRRYYI